MNNTQVVVISVPHTGTNFTTKLFKDQGYQDCSLCQLVEGKAVYQGHVSHLSERTLAKQKARSMPLILPFRHPFRVEESWKRRRKPVTDMVTQFRDYLREFTPLSHFLLPVDSPKREKAIAALNAGLSLALTPDWDHIARGVSGTHDLKLEDCRPSQEVQELAREMKPLLEEWYGDV